METIVIYDGLVPSNSVVRSNSFTNGQVLIFDSPGLPSDESIEFGLSVVAEFNLIGGFKEKVLPVSFLDGNFNLGGDTSLALYIPREINENVLNTYCYFNSSNPFNLRAYCIRNYVTQELLLDTIKQLQTSETLSDLAIITNQINQNAAIAILGASLAPLTLGTSLAVEAPLLTGTSILTPLLLSP